MGETTRILIVDDQELFAVGLKVVIESSPYQLQVVAVAQTGRKAVELVEREHPDIVLMDVRMPEMDGVEATKLIHEKHPDVKILILTTFDDDEYVRDSLEYGAIGYLMKDRPADELVEAIRAVGRGILQIDHAVSEKLLHSAPEPGSRSAEVEARLEYLTQREAQVLGCMVRARRIVEIADELGIAEQTVRNHISNIYGKLDIHDRLELVKYIQSIKRYLGAQKNA
jgi:DNA-binding NarL/FixJ family response regulator